MSESGGSGRGRKPAASKDAAKGFFKANPPKREVTKTEDGEPEKSDLAPLSAASTTEDNDNRQNSSQTAEVSAEGSPSNDDQPVKKRRRRKRRVLLTDTAVKAKKRAEKRLMKDATSSGENTKKDLGGESPAKKEKEKEKEPSLEPVEKKPTLAKLSPFQLFYDHILRKLILKDPEEFFAHPVQPSMAPDYLSIIEQPMDFMTIRNRIDANEYESIDQFRRDINLIWENAMTYNQPNTIYYIAAQKLSVLAKYYLSEQYLEYIRYTFPFGKNLKTTSMQEPLANGRKAGSKPPISNAARRRENFVFDNLNADDIIKATEAKLKSRLTGRLPACGIGYLDNLDGALALNVLVDATNTETGKKRLTLGDIVPPLESGNPGVLGFVEPRLCHDYIVSYMDPGPYASFAPQFDSTWATINKHDSDLLTACYGDRANVADALALRQMVANCCDDKNNEFVDHVDALLDGLTDGEHSRTIKALTDGTPKLPAKPLNRATLSKILDNVKSLKNIGLDLSYIDELTSELGLNSERQGPAVLLDSTGTMLGDLATMNYNRLSAQPQVVLTDIGGPTPAETQLAYNITKNLNTEVQDLGAKPADVVSPRALHYSLGIVDDDDDFAVLREFMDMESMGISAK